MSIAATTNKAYYADCYKGAPELLAPVDAKPPEPRARRRKGHAFSWIRIGPEVPLQLLSVGDAELIHNQLVRDFARSPVPVAPPGIRSRDLLESALFRPYTSLAGKARYPTVAMSAAALFHATVLDHPFHNGNKRTGLVALIVFLDKHGFTLTASEDALYDYVLRVADHKVIAARWETSPDRADREMLAIAPMDPRADAPRAKR